MAFSERQSSLDEAEVGACEVDSLGDSFLSVTA